MKRRARKVVRKATRAVTTAAAVLAADLVTRLAVDGLDRFTKKRGRKGRKNKR